MFVKKSHIFGDRLKVIRRRSELSQQLFMKSIGYAGSASNAITCSRLESGDRYPSKDFIYYICSEHNVAFGELARMAIEDKVNNYRARLCDEYGIEDWEEAKRKAGTYGAWRDKR